MAILDVTRSLGPSESQSHTTDAIGHAEDYTDVVVNIDPDLTFYLSRFGTAEDAVSLKFSWMTEGLEPPQVNAQLEKHDYVSHKLGSMRAAENNIQFFEKSGYVTEAQRKVAKIYKPEDEKVRLVERISKQLGRDMEYALVTNDTTNAENGSNPAITGGVPYFLKSETIECTLDTVDGVVTTTTPHNLKTGEFIYFTATTMPTGLKAQELYYVRLDDSTPATKFTIYNTMNGAIRGIAADQVKPSTTGSDLAIELNNIVDLGGATDYTLDDLNAAMEMAFNRGGNPTIAIMSPQKKRAFSKLITAATTINRGMKADRKLDLVATTIETDWGVLTAESHRMYAKNRIDLMDMYYWDMKWFERVHPINPPKKGTYDEFGLAASFGLKGTQPLASAAITNIKM